MSFFIRNLRKEERLGEKIRALRRHKNITMSEAVEVTKIQRKYLEAFETGQYNRLPEPVYAKNFLRKYISILDGDPDYFIALLEEEIKRCDLIAPHRLPAQRARAIAFFAAHRLWKITVGLLVISALFVYLGWQVNSLLAPPEIVIFEPVDSIEVSEANIPVSGLVKKEAEIFINGNRVVPDSTGRFSTEVVLERGLNIITVEARTRHSKKAVVYRKVVLKQE